MDEQKRVKKILNEIIEILDDKNLLEEYNNYIAFKHNKSAIFRDLSDKLNQLEYVINSSDTKELLKILSDNYDRIMSANLDEIIEEINKESKSFKSLLSEIDRVVLKQHKIKSNGLLKKIYETHNKLEYSLTKLITTLDYLRIQAISSQNSLSSVKNRRTDLITRKIPTIYKSLNAIQKDIQDHYNSIIELLQGVSSSHYLNLDRMRRSLSIANTLHLKLEFFNKGVSSTEFVDIFTGLKSVSAEPLLDEITLTLDEPKSMDIETLFTRYPPVRPIVIKDKYGVLGSQIWLPDFNKDIKTQFYGKKQKMVTGKHYSGAFLIRTVTPINVIDDTSSGFIKIKIFDRNNKIDIFLKYGSDALRKLIKQGLGKSEIERKYGQFIAQQKKPDHSFKHYSPLNLSYIWFCTKGLGLSTDPFDIKCPFISECPYAKICKGKFWSYRRQIHPKVFPIKDRFVEEGKLKFETDGTRSAIITLVKGSEITITEEYSGIIFTMPISRIPVIMKFKTPFVKVLNATNTIGFAIPEFLVDHFIKSIINPSKREEYKVQLDFGSETKNVTIFDILLSKFYIYHKVKNDLNIVSLFKNKAETILNDYLNFREKINKIIANPNSQDPLFDEFLDWMKNVLLHTLAHMLQMYVSKEFDIEINDLLYIYNAHGKYGQYFVLVAENSNLGSIDIIDTLKEWATENNTTRIQFYKKFFNDYRHLLDRHDSELRTRFSVLKDAIDHLPDKEKLVVNKIKETYQNFLDKGLVLDTYYFNIFLALDRNLERIIGGLVSDDKIAKYYSMLDDLITMAIPTYCVDGCVNCVMFEKGCMHHILQPIMISKNLVCLFTDLLLGKLQIYRPGNAMLKDLLTNLPKKKVEITSPYVDAPGVKFLLELAKKGIDVKLKTRKDQIEKLPEDLKREAFKNIHITYIHSDHSKDYKIDDSIRIVTSSNLTLSSSSLNNFMLVDALGK